MLCSTLLAIVTIHPDSLVPPNSLMDYFDHVQYPFDLETVLSDPIDDCAPEQGVSNCQIGTPAEQPNAHADSQLMMSVSTAFHPGAHTDALVPDLIIVSSDNVFFHIHTHRLLKASDNWFNNLLPPEGKTQDGLTPLLELPESSSVLNVVFHTVYSLSCAQFAPSLDTLAAALAALAKYGAPSQVYAAPHMPLFSVLLAHASTRPIDAYALAAAHDLRPLATAVSAHLLAFPLATLSDALAARIGARYLKRLFLLHFGRTEALKGLLLSPPRAHAPVPECNAAQQRTLTRAWALASADLVWDARPNLSTSLIEAVLNPVKNELPCALCKDAMHARIQRLVAEWSSIKRTI